MRGERPVTERSDARLARRPARLRAVSTRVSTPGDASGGGSIERHSFDRLDRSDAFTFGYLSTSSVPLRGTKENSVHV